MKIVYNGLIDDIKMSEEQIENLMTDRCTYRRLLYILTGLNLGYSAISAMRILVNRREDYSEQEITRIKTLAKMISDFKCEAYTTEEIIELCYKGTLIEKEVLNASN